MALRIFRVVLTFVVFVVAVFSATPARAEPSLVTDSPLPTLAAFTRSLAGGPSDQLRGIYIPGLLAHVIVQQAPGEVDFISSDTDTLTEFQMAARLGSIGLLAHNYLAGRDFAGIRPGQMIYLIYGDGRTSTYRVSDALRYQALQPRSVHSVFVDLLGGGRLGAADLFQSIYGRPRALILQTCIERQGISTWGRLFVIAEPFVRRSLQQSHCSDCS